MIFFIELFNCSYSRRFKYNLYLKEKRFLILYAVFFLHLEQKYKIVFVDGFVIFSWI